MALGTIPHATFSNSVETIENNSETPTCDGNPMQDHLGPIADATPNSLHSSLSHSTPPHAPDKPPKRADKRNNPSGKNQFANKIYAPDEVMTERLTAWEKEGKTVGAQMGMLKVEFGLEVGRTTFKKLRERLAIVTKSEVRKLPADTIKSAVLEVAARGLGVVAIHEVLMKSELPVSHGIIRAILKSADPAGLATAVAPAKRIAQRKKELKAASRAKDVEPQADDANAAMEWDPSLTEIPIQMPGEVDEEGGLESGPSNPKRESFDYHRSKRKQLRKEITTSGEVDEQMDLDAGVEEVLQGGGTMGSTAAYESRKIQTSESHERTRADDSDFAAAFGPGAVQLILEGQNDGMSEEGRDGSGSMTTDTGHLPLLGQDGLDGLASDRLQDVAGIANDGEERMGD